MALTRSAWLTVSGMVLGAVSVVAVAYHAWREFSGPPERAPVSAVAPPTVASTAQSSTRAKPQPAPPTERPGPRRAKEASIPPTVVAKPSFDIVRVEPNGDAVVAGRAAPNAKVTLLDKGKPLSTGVTDEGGQFAMTPPALKAGDHELALRVDEGKTTATSAQSVTVVVPQGKNGRLIVAVAAPGEPTKVLADSGAKANQSASQPQTPHPVSPASSAQESRPQVFIRTVEAGQGGDFFATGKAPPGAKMRLYLNDSLIATATANSQGEWSLRVDKGLRPGNYEVRADDVDPVTGKVRARASAPFAFEGFAVAAGAPSAAAAGSRAKDASAVVAQISTVTVVRGDNLWRISRHIFGRGMRYTLIYEANSNQIRNRNLIYPGQVFVVPKG